jgi:hypothetical protein
MEEIIIFLKSGKNKGQCTFGCYICSEANARKKNISGFKPPPNSEEFTFRQQKL